MNTIKHVVYHEAGHIIAAVHYGAKIKGEFHIINTSRTIQGKVTIRNKWNSRDEYAVVFWAGQVAESCYCDGLIDADGTYDDTACAFDLVGGDKSRAFNCRSDAQQLVNKHDYLIKEIAERILALEKDGHIDIGADTYADIVAKARKAVRS